jgi:hypothetical protein
MLCRKRLKIILINWRREPENNNQAEDTGVSDKRKDITNEMKFGRCSYKAYFIKSAHRLSKSFSILEDTMKKHGRIFLQR